MAGVSSISPVHVTCPDHSHLFCLTPNQHSYIKCYLAVFQHHHLNGFDRSYMFLQAQIASNVLNVVTLVTRGFCVHTTSLDGHQAENDQEEPATGNKASAQETEQETEQTFFLMQISLSHQCIWLRKKVIIASYHSRKGSGSRNLSQL